MQSSVPLPDELKAQVPDMATLRVLPEPLASCVPSSARVRLAALEGHAGLSEAALGSTVWA